MKKYKITNERKEWGGTIVSKIKYNMDFPEIGVKAGDEGGWIEKESNLSQEGKSYISPGVILTGDVEVSENGAVIGYVELGGSIKVKGDAIVHGNRLMYGDHVFSGKEIYCTDEENSGCVIYLNTGSEEIAWRWYHAAKRLGYKATCFFKNYPGMECKVWDIPEEECNSFLKLVKSLRNI